LKFQYREEAKILQEIDIGEGVWYEVGSFYIDMNKGGARGLYNV